MQFIGLKPEKLHNAQCRMQNAELMKSFRNGEKIFDGIFKCFRTPKFLVLYRKSFVSSNDFPPLTIKLRFANAKRFIHSAFCILHFAFR